MLVIVFFPCLVPSQLAGINFDCCWLLCFCYCLVPSQLAEITGGGFKMEKWNERDIGVTVFWQVRLSVSNYLFHAIHWYTSICFFTVVTSKC